MLTLNPTIPIHLMVGQSVDIVDQTGNPRTITGFQIHNSPSLIGTGGDYISYSDVMENIVIVKENLDKKGRYLIYILLFFLILKFV